MLQEKCLPHLIVDQSSTQCRSKKPSSSTPICIMAKASPLKNVRHRRRSHLTRLLHFLSKKEVMMGFPNCLNSPRCLVPQEDEKASDYDNYGPMPQLQNVFPLADKTNSSQQELEFLFSPLLEEYFSVGYSSVKKSSSPTDNSKQQDTQPIVNVQQSTTLTNVNAEENNNDIQEGDAQIDENEFINPFCTPVQEVAESSSHNVCWVLIYLIDIKE
ncbi:hypothetical protein Tco_0756693 [Tanacetum coccineum]